MQYMNKLQNCFLGHHVDAQWTLHEKKKGNLVHVAPACAGSREGSDHFGSIVRSLSTKIVIKLYSVIVIKLYAYESVADISPSVINMPMFPMNLLLIWNGGSK